MRPSPRNLHPSLLLVILLAPILAACGDSGTEPRERYESLAGSYGGVMAGISQGILLTAEFSLTLSQNQGALTGTYAMTGFLTDGFYEVQILGTGTVTGSIAAGPNPSVNLTVLPAGCPNQPAQFSGSYDSTNRRLTLAGPVRIHDEGCGVLLTYPMTLVLER